MSGRFDDGTVLREIGIFRHCPFGLVAAPKRPKPSKPGDVAPPMPGRVVKVLVEKDQRVEAGDPLLIIEAMKMESRVPAPLDGKVVAILVSEGENVKTDETVIQLE